jgi:hypothetical protein
MSAWYLPADWQKRRRIRAWSRQKAVCRICCTDLGYEVNSIKWQCQDDDLCPKHAAESAVKRLMSEATI